MNIKTLLRTLASLLVFSTALAPVFVSAQTDVGASANAGVTATGVTTGTAVSATVNGRTQVMTNAITRADKEIARRIAALNDANTRVQGMQEVTPAFKTSLSTALQAQITALTALQTKIDADTDLTTLKADVRSVTSSYRIFALVLPQVHIAAMADREVTIATMLTTLGTKLQARVTSAQSAGADTTALAAALTDMSAKLSDASSQAQAAVSATASLAPDNGDKTVMASNLAALKGARKNLQTAQQDLVAARKDATTITAGLKASASTSSTTPATSATTNTTP